MENHGLDKKALEHSRRIRETAFSALVDPFRIMAIHVDGEERVRSS
jgi:hypothetical protein